MNKQLLKISYDDGKVNVAFPEEPEVLGVVTQIFIEAISERLDTTPLELVEELAATYRRAEGTAHEDD